MSRIITLLAILTLAGCASTSTPNASLSATIKKAANDASPDYRKALTDLDQDGLDDAIVLLQGTNWCGSGGCTMLVLQGTDSGYDVVSRSTVTGAPIHVASTTHHGWRDILVYSDGSARRMQFDGQSYPLNPSLQPRADQDTLNTARPLLPGL